MSVKRKKDTDGKYPPALLIAMFRKAAELRNEMNKAGFTDNGGAIHSAERILNILGMRLNYPGLNHINNLRNYRAAQFSSDAWELHRRGEKVLIEHISPLRDLTRKAIEKIDSQVTDESFRRFVKQHFKLALLSPDETKRLNAQNRSKMHPSRLLIAGIQVTQKSRSNDRGAR
jgi:hypothetical protein